MEFWTGTCRVNETWLDMDENTIFLPRDISIFFGGYGDTAGYLAPDGLSVALLPVFAFRK